MEAGISTTSDTDMERPLYPCLLYTSSHTPASAMSLSEEITMLRKRVKEQDKEIRRLKEENEFLEEASAFFAASRRKSVKTRE